MAYKKSPKSHKMSLKKRSNKVSRKVSRKASRKCMAGKSHGAVVVKSYVSKSGKKVKCHRRKSPKLSRKGSRK